MCMTNPFILKDLVIHDEEEKKTNASDPLTAGQRSSGRFLSFMMTVHSYQADTNFNYSRMTCRTYIKLLLGLDEIDASIDTRMLKKTTFF